MQVFHDLWGQSQPFVSQYHLLCSKGKQKKAENCNEDSVLTELHILYIVHLTNVYDGVSWMKALNSDNIHTELKLIVSLCVCLSSGSDQHCLHFSKAQGYPASWLQEQKWTTCPNSSKPLTSMNHSWNLCFCGSIFGDTSLKQSCASLSLTMGTS